MTETPPVTGALTGNSSQTGQAGTPPPRFGEEFNSFIQLLTAQVQNQDPLSPLDSTQFVEQLATFSTLEQQVNSNSHLEQIASMIGELQATIASDWLGQTVSVESSWVPFDGEGVDFTADIPADTEQAILTVRDAAGAPVWSELLDIGEEAYRWDGRFADGGQAVRDQVYQFGIDLYRGETYLGTLAPRIITTVTGVASENGQLRLGTQSHLTTDLGNVRKVDPES